MTVLRRAVAAVGFLGYFLRELVVANATVAWEVATPGTRLHPGVARVVLRARSPLELTVVADALSLTPGSLVLELRPPGEDGDDAVIFIHGLHVGDVDAFRRRVHRLEDRLLAVTR